MFKNFIIAITGLAAASFAQDFSYCAKPIATNPGVFKIEGHFLNEKISQTSISIEWHHNPAVQDSFFISATGAENQLFVTAGDYRFVKYTNTGAKRQIGGRQLRENIGETPMKFDDLELLANGWFKCQDSSAVDPMVLTTAIPETQAVLALDTLPLPREISVQRWNDDRSYSITEWKDMCGNKMPETVQIFGKNFSGSIKFFEVQPPASN
ncbi:MAG: hypothetical protein HUK20_03985 [Fibrobacter sp.]|nr:hypothetical protein [Fibrobacter sp.]